MIYVWLALLLSIPFGCSGDRELSRSKAETVLKTSAYFNGPPQTLTLDVPEVMPVLWVQALQQKGYIKIGQQVNPFLARVSLTPKGLEESKHWTFIAQPYQQWIIPLATREFVEITGIQQQQNQALVEYRWRPKLTKYGEELKNVKGMDLSTAVRSDQVSFARYDDGWRVMR